MKKLSFIFVLFLLTAFSAASSAQTSANSANPAVATYKVKVFFHCGNGKALIEKEMVKKNGILKVTADIESKEVVVEYDKTIITDTKTIVEYFHQIGYLTADSPKDTKIEKACSHGDEGEHKH